MNSLHKCRRIWREFEYGREDEANDDSSVFVKYNRMLHGMRKGKVQKRDTLTIKFLKKYIHYAKHRIQPELTDEVQCFTSLHKVIQVPTSFTTHPPESFNLKK